MQDITKLKAAGVCTILGVAQTTRKNLLKIKVSVELHGVVNKRVELILSASAFPGGCRDCPKWVKVPARPSTAWF
jgi:hypothetical protein